MLASQGRIAFIYYQECCATAKRDQLDERYSRFASFQLGYLLLGPALKPHQEESLELLKTLLPDAQVAVVRLVPGKAAQTSKPGTT